MKTATFISTLPRGTVGSLCVSTGIRELFRMEPPLEGHPLVVVSQISKTFDTGQPETYIFSADDHGNVTDWCGLEGSFQGLMDADQALRNAGYEVIR